MKISIEGMHSQECVKRVRRALEKIEGLQVREVAIGFAIVDSADKAHEALALEAIQKAGYQPHIPA
jgi:copper chaperone CopZ